MPISAHIAWLIIKIAFFFLISIVVLSLLLPLALRDDAKREKVTMMIADFLKWPLRIVTFTTPLCLVFLLGVWLFAPEYLPNN